MSTSAEVRQHLQAFKSAVGDAMQTLADYQVHGSQYTADNQTSERAKITVVNGNLIHASDCAICTAWDGS